MTEMEFSESVLCWFYQSWVYRRWLHLRYGLFSNLINAKYFFTIAWRFAIGKLILIDTNEVKSNGGYRYISLLISKRPVSHDHTYEDM